jgi:hypothetical protein
VKWLPAVPPRSGALVRRWHICWALVALSLAVASPAFAQKKSILFGVVTNLDGVRLSRVEVTIAQSDFRMVTNDSGEFIFNAPPTGRVRLLVKRLGFKQQEKGFKLGEGESKQVDFELEGIPELLDSVIVLEQGGNGKMAEFWARRAMGNGAFITRAEIQKRNPYRMSDMLRMLSGVRVSTNGSDAERPVISMGRTPMGVRTYKNVQSLAGECKVSYYLDGNWVSPGTFHPDDLTPGTIEAMEVYRGPAEIPAKFRQRETACGMIVIWTREPPPRERGGA